jgi:hypothetical protein
MKGVQTIFPDAGVAPQFRCNRYMEISACGQFATNHKQERSQECQSCWNFCRTQNAEPQGWKPTLDPAVGLQNWVTSAKNAIKKVSFLWKFAVDVLSLGLWINLVGSWDPLNALLTLRSLDRVSAR